MGFFEEDDSDLVVEEKEREEDTDSTYESAPSSSSDEFYTAPPPSEKELHSDLIFCIPDYAQDIYCYLRERESDVKLRPKISYMRKQTNINRAMRQVLVDWLVDVCLEYTLAEETLHLAVGYVDRFLSVMDIPKEKLQLVGTTATMIAAKYEEIYPPELMEFVYITDDTYAKKQVMKMERLMLDTLRFEVASPTASCFASKYLKVCRADQRARNMAMYLCDLSLMEYDILAFLPSKVAGASVCLANLMTQAEPWPLELAMSSGYTVLDIFECLKVLLKRLQKVKQSSQQAVFEKYKDVKYCQVALIEPPDSLPEIVH